MAEFVSGVAAEILGKLADEAHQKVALAWGLKNDVERLQGSMRVINGFLKDAENKQSKNHGITEWLQQLKDVFYDASDALDEMECEALRKEVVKEYGSITRKVCRFVSPSNSLLFYIKMAEKIKDIRERIDDIASFRTKFDLVDEHHANDLNPFENMPWRETHSYVESSLVIGRDEEKDEIIRFLMSPRSTDSRFDVLPIVGMGGLGKTALAKLVYNDVRVMRHFQLQIWVCVSDDFDVKRIALKILKSTGTTNRDAQNLTLEQVQSLFRKELHDKMFLLVLDDVWNENRKSWLDLRELLLGIPGERGKNDSKIIVTTRSDEVASIMKTVSQHNLRELPEDDCLKLFFKCAFQESEEEKHPRLIKIGKEIVRKCRGVPLAVVSLGCLLYSKVDENQWIRVRDSEIWKLKEQDDGILPALRLSYNHLPSQLKQCFSYCSIFPKDYCYNNYELISFWLAHGLLQSTNEDEEPEDVGEFYIKELISRFFFQDIEEFDPVPGFYNFKMHDLIHDLAMSTMQSEAAVVTVGSTGINEKVRHISFLDNDGAVPHLGQPLRKVRTIGLSHASDGGSFITEPFLIWISNKFRYLRVLDLQKSLMKLLPDYFAKMKHLRYLDLRLCIEMETLPESICELQNLQTLYLGGCTKLQKFPKHMKNLVMLRVLTLTTRAKSLSNSGIGCLKSLQILGLAGCNNLVCLPRDFSHLTALKKLIIFECPQLVSLEEEGEEKMKIEGVRNLSLRLLSIGALPKLTALPSWLKRSANTLQHMAIFKCTNLRALPEWLPKLTALQMLSIDSCSNLSSLPNDVDLLSNLEKLKITDCPQLVSSYKRDALHWPKISHIQNVILDYEKQ